MPITFLAPFCFRVFAAEVRVAHEVATSSTRRMVLFFTRCDVFGFRVNRCSAFLIRCSFNFICACGGLLCVRMSMSWRER